MAAYAGPLTAPDLVVLSIVVMRVETALINTHLTLDAALRVPLNDEFWW